MVASYLQHAQIGVILGDTLFVHGAVEERALGFIPSPLTRYKLNSTSAWREPKCLDWLVVSRIFWNFHPDKLGKGFNLTSIFFHIFSYGLVQPPTSLDWNFLFVFGMATLKGSCCIKSSSLFFPTANNGWGNNPIMLKFGRWTLCFLCWPYGHVPIFGTFS